MESTESLLCAICLNTNTALGFSVTEPCGHAFHTKCLRQWSTGSQNSILQCPKCRCRINKHFQLYVDYDDNSNAKKLASKNAKQAEEIKNLKSNLIKSSSKITNLSLKMASDKVEMNNMIRSFNKVDIGHKKTIIRLKDELCSAQKELTAIKNIQELEAKKLKSSMKQNQKYINVGGFEDEYRVEDEYDCFGYDNDDYGVEDEYDCFGYDNDDYGVEDEYDCLGCDDDYWVENEY